MTFAGTPEAVRAIYTADPDTLGVWGIEASEPADYLGAADAFVARALDLHARER